MTAATIHDAATARRFALAGAARLTLSSARTGARYTFRFKQAEPNISIYFVSLLTGPDNDADYTYIGLLDAGSATLPQLAKFRLTGKSKLPETSAPVRAARFFCERVIRDGAIPDGLEVRHEGRCGRCGRALTTPESVDRGIGPECWAAMGGEV